MGILPGVSLSAEKVIREHQEAPIFRPLLGGFFQFFYDFSNFLGRFQPKKKNTMQETPDTLGLEESSST